MTRSGIDKRQWLSVLAMAAYWLFGLEIYHAPQADVSLAFLAAGIILNWGVTVESLDRRASLGAAVLLLPVMPNAPDGLQLVAVLLCAGLGVRAIPRLPLWSRLSAMLLVSGFVLFFQLLAVHAYLHFTAVYQHVPSVLTHINAWLLRLAGYSVGTGDGQTSIFVMREVLSLSSGWGYFFGPCAAAFFVGCIALLLVDFSSAGFWVNRKRFLKAVGLIALAALVWVILKTSVLTAVVTFRAWITDYDDPLNLMSLFYSGWVRVVALCPIVFVLNAVVKRPTTGAGLGRGVIGGEKSVVRSVLVFAVGVVALVFSLHLDVVGDEKSSKVLVDESHGDWESTRYEYDTEWYGERSGYNYYVIYDYLSHFFEMERLFDEISVQALRGYDVLVLKVPTRPYSESEQLAIVRYVSEGGGLLLLGEHTDVFRSSSYLNEVARRFGFEFRNDALLHIDNVFEQRFTKPYPAHPILSFLTEMDFAVSSSIDTDNLMDRVVVTGTGLRGLRADYHMANYYAQVADYTDVDYGSFIQLLAKRFGKGRIVAFSDSTAFSNFCVFEEGKSELMMGMVAWLNRAGGSAGLRLALIALSLMVVVIGGLKMGCAMMSPHLALVATVVAWSLGLLLVDSYHETAMPFPERARDFVDVSIDRSLSSVPLSKGGFLKGDEDGYGIFEQWLLRLGYFTHRRDRAGLFEGDLVVFFNPDQPVSEAFSTELKDYLGRGGKVLVIDSVYNKNSTANALLEDFGLRIRRQETVSGVTKSMVPDWPTVEVEASLVVDGPRVLITCDEQAVLSHASHGDGDVFVAGFGADLADARMGVNTDVEPSEAQRRLYDLQFAISRYIVGGGGK